MKKKTENVKTSNEVKMIVIKLIRVLIIIRRIQGYYMIGWKAVAQKWIFSHPQTRRRGHIGRVCNIVIRNWNINFCRSFKALPCIYGHTIEISYVGGTGFKLLSHV